MRQEVVQRDDDILTPTQLKEHWPEIQKAMLKELQTWAKLKCFSRRARRQARNIIDVRWVIKFKWEIPTSSVGESQPTETNAQPVRTIRARLTVRGFKDQQKADIDRYAGTSSRSAQKLLVSEAVKWGWPMCTADISKAFLQGVTYEELAKLTGEPMREVNFYLPADNIPLLHMIPGFEDFDPQSEVLHCDKPGTGLGDAPRAFSIKLRGVTDECKLVPSQVDNELVMRHDEGQPTAVMTKHVDDLKLTGWPDRTTRILSAIQKVFGELKVEWYLFTNCGVRHIQDKVSREVTLDQILFANNLKPIVHAQLKAGKADDLCFPDLHKLFMSLLGAVAYLSHTRTDVVVFICALQRYTSKPQVIHVRKLNKLLGWIQRNPRKLAYRRFERVGSGGGQQTETGTHLRIVSDAAFKKETDDGYSLRGALFCRGSGQQTEAFSSNKTIHLIDQVCKSQRHVCRSTFAAELLAAGDAADHGILLSHMIYELEHGPLTAYQARLRRMDGGYLPTAIYLDAKSVFAAVSATFIKQPAEKSLLCHVQYLRELLDKRIISWMFWVDTRDMYSDGLTKGAVSRELLHLCMQGNMPFKHEFEQWRSKISMVSGGQPTEAHHTEANLTINLSCREAPTIVHSLFSLQLPPHFTNHPKPTQHFPSVAVPLSGQRSGGSRHQLTPSSHPRVPLALGMSSSGAASAADAAWVSGSQPTEAESTYIAEATLKCSYKRVPNFDPLVWAEHIGPFPKEDFYNVKGEWYRKKFKTSDKEVNGSLAVDDVQRYALKWPPELRCTHGKVEQHVPWPTAEAWVTTTLRAAQEGGLFIWPAELTVQKAVAAAMSHMSPGTVVSVRNEMPYPGWALDPDKVAAMRSRTQQGQGGGQPTEAWAAQSGTAGTSSGGWWQGGWSGNTYGWQDQGWWDEKPRQDWSSWGSWASWEQAGGGQPTEIWHPTGGAKAPTETVASHNAGEPAEALQPERDERNLLSHIGDVYHGTYAETIPKLLAEGWKPGLGAGCTALLWQHGVEVPGVYVAHGTGVSTTYPNECTTEQVTLGDSTFKSVPGGTLLALDGTPPVRAVLRMVADPYKRLWHRGSNQVLYKPEDLFITHVLIYAVGAPQVHRCSLYQFPVCSDLSYSLEDLKKEGYRGGQPTEAVCHHGSPPTEAVVEPKRQTGDEEIGDVDIEILNLLHNDAFVPCCPKAAEMVRLGQGHGFSGNKHLHLRAMTNAKLPYQVSRHLKREDTYYMSKTQDIWVKKELPTLRIGYVEVNNPSCLAIIFGCTAEEAVSFRLGGTIAIEVDYRMVIFSAPKSSGSQPTEAGPAPNVVLGRKLLQCIQQESHLPTLRKDKGVTNVMMTTAGALTTDMQIVTGSSGSQPTEAGAERSAAAKRRANKPDEKKKHQQEVDARRNYRNTMATVLQYYGILPLDYYSSYKGQWELPETSPIDFDHKFIPVPKLYENKLNSKHIETRRARENQGREDYEADMKEVRSAQEVQEPICR